MSEKTSAEEADNSLSPFLEAEQTKENTLRAWKAGDSNGYSRGKAEAEKRIWEALEKHSIRGGGWIEETLADLKQIIFGGGE
jgi:hypothetical protein